MASSIDTALLSSELKKLKKDELVDIIVFKKLPNSVTSEVLKNFVNIKSTCEELTINEMFHDSQEYPATICVNQSCADIKMNYQKLSNETDIVRKLSFHLEKRTEEQSELINFLKLEINALNINNHNTIQSTPSTSKPQNIDLKKSDVNKLAQTKTVHVTKNPNLKNSNIEISKTSTNYQGNSTRMNLDPKTQTAVQVNNSIANSQHMDKPQETIKNNNNKYDRNQRYNKRKPIIGSNNQFNDTLKTVPKLGFLHVYRIDPTMTADDLTKCLKETASHIPFKCDLLNKTERQCSFIVSFPLNHVREVYDSGIWPLGAAVNRFVFRPDGPGSNFRNPASKNRSSQQKPATQEEEK